MTVERRALRKCVAFEDTSLQARTLSVGFNNRQTPARRGPAHSTRAPVAVFAPLGKTSLPQKRNVRMVRQFAVSAEGIMCKPRDCAAVDMEGRTYSNAANPVTA